MKSQVPPDTIKDDIELARNIYNGLMIGDKNKLKYFIEINYGFFINFSQRQCYKYIDPTETFHSFFVNVLNTGNIFNSYQGENNCRLRTYITHALHQFIKTENRKRSKNKIRETVGIPAGGEELENNTENIFIENIIKNKLKIFRLKNQLENKKLISFVNALFNDAFKHGYTQINLSFSKNVLDISICTEGKQQKYSANRNINFDNLVIPRIKSIFKLDPLKEITESKPGQLALIINGKQIFLTLTSQYDDHDQEIVTITLSDMALDKVIPKSQSIVWPNLSSTFDDDIDDNNEETDTTDPPVEISTDPISSPIDMLFQNITLGDSDENQRVPTKHSVHSSQLSGLDNHLEIDSIFNLIKEAMELFTEERPLDAKLINLRMKDYDFNEIAEQLEEEYYSAPRAPIYEKIPEKKLRKRMADHWKHRYERKDGPSALSRFTILFERLLVAKGIQLDSSLRCVDPVEVDPVIKELFDNALENLAKIEPDMAKILADQLSLMKMAEFGLLFGTRNGRPITKKNSLKTEFQKLQKQIRKLLQERGEELTVMGGKSIVHKI